MAVRSWWGWGWADQALDAHELEQLADRVRAFLPLDGEITRVPAVPELRAPRLKPPSSVECRADDEARASHSYGKAYRDVIRCLNQDLASPPDLVVYPADADEVQRAMAWAAERGAAVIPYGGGSSVVGGVEYRGADRPVVVLDLSKLDEVLEIDEVSLAVRTQAGIFGPALEHRLRPKGLTLRHFPQSFEFSTVGGWLATRAGGHFATGYTHIDDLVESMSVLTPTGMAHTARVPASGAGPEPNRLWLGSEGALGVITEAWLRVQQRPVHKEGVAIAFETFGQAVTATRLIAQSGLNPANCRLLDPLEAMLGAGALDGGSRLILGFESADHPVSAQLKRAIEICRGQGGVASDAEKWRGTFLRGPYLRDGLARLGVVVETFETACTWSNFESLHTAVLEAVAPGFVTCRFTHVYPDGPAPYFTVYATAPRGGEVAVWDELKAHASQALLANGGTITHHHAVGRDHVPWYHPPGPFTEALRAVKRTLDPQGILNPGVLGLG
ncbi:alkyldihydroxyacetonephosphate synthase [Rhizocola hellebori]|uniref:Alkyldihydroxyacetonephosphate synthase n=1 Tax=Rhizocola hellebori TaxID=1392758 RepID=A0A8J3QKN3_9ACTN|nr:FAD-binding oxidoreductase [Rhizocola hellebori]GIH11539.1 alkyldihydroxyacetonephosphate synthase [Rhizocola hellebori]